VDLCSDFNRLNFVGRWVSFEVECGDAGEINKSSHGVKSDWDIKWEFPFFVVLRRMKWRDEKRRINMSDRKLRKFEQQLDQHYKTFQIYNRPADIRLYALLASYDSMFLPFALVPRVVQKSPRAALFFKTLDDSLSYCIRWLSNPKPKNLISTPNYKIIEEADEFLLFGADYANIADMHMMYGRNLVTVEIDENQKKVRFKINDEHKDKKEIHGYLQTHAFHQRLAQQNAKKAVQSATEYMKALSQISCEYLVLQRHKGSRN